MICAIALSRAARTLITRRLAGEEVALTEETRRHYERLTLAGFIEPGSDRLTAEALARRREFLSHDGPPSDEAMAQLRRHMAGDRQVKDANRVAYRELAAAGLMSACHSFAGGDESVYRLTETGARFAGVLERKPDTSLSAPAHAESA